MSYQPRSIWLDLTKIIIKGNLTNFKFGSPHFINKIKNYKNNYLSTHNISSIFKYINSSRDYWENRYKNGGNSGAGSYNNLAAFKAKVINNFVTENNINTILELGSGDCNQLSYANYKNYFGYDFSKTAIDICKKNLIIL